MGPQGVGIRVSARVSFQGEEFETGLRTLGFRADAVGVFRSMASMDPCSSGLVNLKALLKY